MRVTLERMSLDTPWPPGPFDLVVLSEVAYYLEGDALARVLAQESARLPEAGTVVAAHWRHPVGDYPLTGDMAHDVIAATPGLVRLGGYRDGDVVIDVFGVRDGRSVAERAGIPGVRRRGSDAGR